MLIGARQDCVAGGQDVSEKMAILRRMGLDFLELAMTREEIAGIASLPVDTYVAAVEQTGLPIRSTSMGHFGGFGTMEPAARAEIVDQIRGLIDWTRAIGADAILLATREDGTHVEEYAGVYHEMLLPVADAARDAGVTLCLEHVGWYKPHVLAKLVEAIGHPAIGIYFDMGNCLYVGESPLEQARTCAPLVAQLHIKGGPTTPLGAMPLQHVREILEGAGFRGRGCLEIEPRAGDRHLAEARGLLKMAGYC